MQILQSKEIPFVYLVKRTQNYTFLKFLAATSRRQQKWVNLIRFLLN